MWAGIVVGRRSPDPARYRKITGDPGERAGTVLPTTDDEQVPLSRHTGADENAKEDPVRRVLVPLR